MRASQQGSRTPWVLWRLIRFRPGLFAAHLVWVDLILYTTPFLGPLVVRALLDRVTGESPAGLNVTTLLVLFVAVGLMRGALSAVGPVVQVTMQQTASALFRANMLERVLRRPGARALPASPGEALVRFEKDPQALVMALDFMADPIGQVVAYAIALTVMARVDLFLTVAVVLPALGVMFVVNLATPRIREARLARQEALGEVSSLLGESFAAAVAIKAAGAEDRVTARLEHLNEVRRRTTLRDLLIDQVMRSFGTNVGTLAVGVLLFLAAPAARRGDFSVGDFALFTSYLVWLGTVVAHAGTIVTLVRQADVSIGRMRHVLHDAPAEELVAFRPLPMSGPLPPLEQPSAQHDDALERLEARGLSFAYPDSGRGISDIDLDISRGELVVVTGRIGSGKTTLLRTLLGLLPADSGEVRWNGLPVDTATFLVPPRCAYTSQVPRLFSLPLRDNVLLGLDAGDDALSHAAHAAVLEDDLAALGAGWDTRIGPRGLKLSGGQIQRTAAARMFVRSSELLVFDDLSSALDVDTEEVLWDRLFRRPGATCLVVTHRRPALRRADRVLVLREGQVEAYGELAELLRTSAEMRDLWRQEA